MEFELMPQTPAGERFVKLAEELARFVAERAAEHDRDGTFPFEAYAAMKDAGLLRATVPEELGGLGLVSMRDLAIGLGRLARGDGSVAIGLNMHLCTTWIVARMWRDTTTAGLNAADTAFVLERVVDGDVVMASYSEPGTDVRRPMTEITRVPEGWRLNGRKTFGTLSPIADLIFVLCRSVDETHTPHSHWALVYRESEGVHVLDNWDSLGLRATGSHDLVFDEVLLRDGQVMPPVPWGEDHELSLITSITGNIGLVSSFLGIAERAHELAVRTARTQSKDPGGRPLSQRAGIQRSIAESEIDLTTGRALIERVGRLLDWYVTEPLEAPAVSEMHALNAQFQAAKFEVTRRAVAIVDRSLAVAGGTGYLASHPLARLYRDVRAGPLMQPYSPNEVHEYIGKVALGLDPVIAE